MINYRKAKPADIPTLIQMRLGYMHETHTDLKSLFLKPLPTRPRAIFRSILTVTAWYILRRRTAKPQAACSSY